MIPVVLLTGYLLFLVVNILITVVTNIMFIAELVLFGLVHIITLFLLPLVIDILLFKIIASGYSCSYKADNLEFVLKRQDKTLANILYKDAVSVEYKPLKFLWLEQGVRVKITMKNYALNFNYVVPRKMLSHPENFPFEIIRHKIGEQNAI